MVFFWERVAIAINRTVTLWMYENTRASAIRGIRQWQTLKCSFTAPPINPLEWLEFFRWYPAYQWYQWISWSWQSEINISLIWIIRDLIVEYQISLISWILICRYHGYPHLGTTVQRSANWFRNGPLSGSVWESPKPVRKRFGGLNGLETLEIN